MVTRADIIATARSYAGVRWHHQGRNRAGLDCIGLLIVVAHQLGLSDFDVDGYARVPDGRSLRAGLDAHLDRVAAYTPGDVLLMRFEREPQHVALVTDHEGGIGILHAYAQVRRVVEHRLDKTWASRIVGAYAFRGVA